MKKIIATAALLAGTLVLLAAVMTGTAGARPDRLHQQRLEVGRALLEVQADGWPSVLPYYTDDIEYHDPIVDIQGIGMMTQFLARLFGASPDLVTTIEDETLDKGTYAAAWTMVGRFNGVPYSAKGISIIKFLPGRAQAYYQRDYYSENDIMITIPGLDQAAIGFRTYYRCAVDPTFACPLEGGGPLAEAAAAAAPPVDPPHAGMPGRRLGESVRLQRERMEIGRALIEINAADWQSLLPSYTDDIAYRDPIVAIDGIGVMVPFLGRLFTYSPDLVTTVEDESLVGDVYTATWTMTGQFDGIPYSAPGMSIVKFRAGTAQVFYSRDYYTEGDIMATIPGLDQAVGAFRTYYRCAVDPGFACPETASPDKARTPGPAPAFGLAQNAPNPFNPATTIAFTVPAGGARVTLRVYDVTGRLVRTLVDGFEPGGARSVAWQGRDDAGRPLASGTYVYRLAGPGFAQSRTMVLMK